MNYDHDNGYIVRLIEQTEIETVLSTLHTYPDKINCSNFVRGQNQLGKVKWTEQWVWEWLCGTEREKMIENNNNNNNEMMIIISTATAEYYAIKSIYE